jgi:coenzyme F420-reducing hydrogenase delta subunit
MRRMIHFILKIFKNQAKLLIIAGIPAGTCKFALSV